MSGKRLKIGFVNAWGAQRKNWSGTPFYMARALELHCGEVVHYREISGGLPIFRAKIANKLTFALAGKRHDWLHTYPLSRRYARYFQEEIRRTRPDVLFGCAAASEIALLETDLPMVGSSDATAALNRNYYTSATHLTAYSNRVVEDIERRYLHKMLGLLYSTKWAADSAVRDYGVSPSRVFSAPYGANLDGGAIPPRAGALREKQRDVCRLLFLGVDWERKGGAIAVETLKCLLTMGVPAELTVCGCVPPAEYQYPKIRVIPFLDKNTPDGMNSILRLLYESHFLLLPTRAEAFGIVFCEAAAFGLPSISTDTGGVSGVVSEGRNGHLLPLSAGGEDYAGVIASCFTDFSRYEQLRRTSREEYEERLNWDAWGRAAARILTEIL